MIVKAVAWQCFELFVQNDREYTGGISAEAYIDVEVGVHERLGVLFAPSDVAAEFAEEIVKSGIDGNRSSVAGWGEYWRFIRTQMNDIGQDVPEMYSYLLAVLAVLSELSEDAREENAEVRTSWLTQHRRVEDGHALGSRTMRSQLPRSRIRRGLSPRLRN